MSVFSVWSWGFAVTVEQDTTLAYEKQGNL